MTEGNKKFKIESSLIEIRPI